MTVTISPSTKVLSPEKFRKRLIYRLQFFAPYSPAETEARLAELLTRMDYEGIARRPNQLYATRGRPYWSLMVPAPNAIKTEMQIDLRPQTNMLTEVSIKMTIHVPKTFAYRCHREYWVEELHTLRTSLVSGKLDLTTLHQKSATAGMQSIVIPLLLILAAVVAVFVLVQLSSSTRVQFALFISMFGGLFIGVALIVIWSQLTMGEYR